MFLVGNFTVWPSPSKHCLKFYFGFGRPALRSGAGNTSVPAGAGYELLVQDWSGELEARSAPFSIVTPQPSVVIDSIFEGK